MRSSLTILALGLPTFFVLWLLRTHDVKKQIDKTEENTNNSTFFECVRMLTDPKQADEKTASGQFRLKRIALEQLAYLNRETEFNKERIKPLTQELNLKGLDLSYADLGGLDNLDGLNLSRADLSDADLSNANLGGANLSGANLSNVNLSNADLSNADLSNANLSNANLSNADLSNADLSNANLSGLDLSGALFPDSAIGYENRM